MRLLKGGLRRIRRQVLLLWEWVVAIWRHVLALWLLLLQVELRQLQGLLSG